MKSLPVVWEEHHLDERVRSGVSVWPASLEVFGAQHADIEDVSSDVMT